MRIQSRHKKRWAIIWFNKFLIELLLIYIPISFEKRYWLDINWWIKLALIITIIIFIIERFFKSHPKYNKLLWKLRVSLVLLICTLLFIFNIYEFPKWHDRKTHE